MPFSKMAGASSASSSLRRQNASEQLGLSDSGSPPGKGPRIDLGDIAKKVPQVKRSGDEAKYASDCLTRNAFVRAVELMERNPHVIMECWAWLDTKVNGQSGANDNQVWDKCVTHWSKALYRSFNSEMTPTISDFYRSLDDLQFCGLGLPRNV